MTVNIIDTPGHADFGGEVERGLSMVDGVALLVDASEGPLPQTRFVLRKAIAGAPAGRPRRQQGRPPGRADRGGGRRDLRAVPRPGRRTTTTRPQPRLPDRLRLGQVRPGPLTRPADGAQPDGPDLEPLFRTILESVPAPTYDDTVPLQAHVTNLDASPFLGRLALWGSRSWLVFRARGIF